MLDPLDQDALAVVNDAPAHGARTLPDPYTSAPKSGEFQRLRRRLTRQTQAAIMEYDLIQPGDHVLVCCSGGKDSYAMLSILADLSRRPEHGFAITAFNLDQGQPGFPTETLPDHFRAHGLDFHIETQDTYSIVTEKIAPGKTTCGLCSRLRRGIIYTVAERLGANKIALGHHRDDAIETLLLNLFFGAQLKSMPPKLSALEGQHTLIRPLYNCAEEDLARFARAMAYPIIPCNLCGSQPNLQRRAFKTLLSEWEVKFPGRKEAIFKALKHVVPSHLADKRLFDFTTMKDLAGTGRSAEAPDASANPADFFAQIATSDTGFLAQALGEPTQAVDP